ncbi:hypothetical protein [Paenibacillus ihumii]|nr:hypothetical protein [Paenibacillus ihumii]
MDAFKFAQGTGYPYTEELQNALKKVENGLHGAIERPGFCSMSRQCSLT